MSNPNAYSPILITTLKQLEPFWDEAGYFLALISENALSEGVAEELTLLLNENFEMIKEWEMTEKMQRVKVVLREMKNKELEEKEAYSWEFFL